MRKFSIFLVIVIVLAGGWYFLRGGFNTQSLFVNPMEYRGTQPITASSSPDLAKEVSMAGDAPLGYVKYANSKYSFSYYHSPEASVKEYDEGGGAMTVVQENVAKVRGLQIFIVPYAESQITDERFRKDVPSGVRYNIENTTVGVKRIPAVTFNSYDDFLGETRELWFIHDNYLYEVTTFKGFGDWFAPIIQTWRFED